MKKISVKLTIFFIMIIVISSVISIGFSMLMSPSVFLEIRKDQMEIVTSLEKLSKTRLSLDEMIDILSNSTYQLEVVETAKNIDEKLILEGLKEGEVLYLPSARSEGMPMVVNIRGNLVKVGLNPDKTIFSMTAYRIWDSYMFYVLIGAIMIVVLVRRVVKPILMLTQATQEVALGNFDVEVKIESDDEIGVLTHNFNRMVKELKHMEILRKDFISNVSHEFKTPMASIQGFAKLLKDKDIDDEHYDEYVDIIIEETGRLSRLSSNLLKLSRLENQAIPDMEGQFSLDEQLRRCILILSPKWDKKDIEFELDLDNIIYSGNEELLQQVWLNVIENAIKFTPQGGTIEVSANKQAFDIHVRIRDNGIGMDKDTLDRIFEQFYQGDMTHTGDGSGLGLPLAKRIIEIYSGSIEVSSTQGEGTVFDIKLPISRQNTKAVKSKEGKVKKKR